MSDPSHGPGGPAGGPQSVPQSYSYPDAADASGVTDPAQGVGLADEPSTPGAGKSRRTGLIAGGVAAVVLLGGAGVFAAQQLSGGGSQPADVLPGDAYAYVRLDIDPSAGQKIAAVRFLGKVPQIQNTLGSGDPRKKLWDLAAKDSNEACMKAFNYDNDIAPWLGDRIGLALRPGGTKDAPNIAMAVQVKDEDAARTMLTKLQKCGDSGSDSDLRMKDGYAIITPKGVGDATLAATAKGSLAQNTTFTGDMSALGEQGVMSAWMDMGRGLSELQKLGATSGMGAVPTANAKGRFTAALRFDADYVELAGLVRGADATKTVKGDGSELASLPANTMAALQLSGGDQAVDTAWPALKKQLDTLTTGGQGGLEDMVQQQLGLKLPDDLKALLGRSFTLSLPDQDFQSAAPAIGAKIVSSDAKRADAVITKLLQAGGGGVDLTHRVEGDKVYVATTSDYADDLKAGGRLGDSDAFKQAVGDVSGSNAALFLDLDKLEKLYLPGVHGQEKTFLESLKAVGLNATQTGAGEATFTLRVLGN
ncbi:DUF3352 domain-containing protein [Intrasporangium sp. YIM S08009]|uniref:DUF3352 domain-containing protein n=1 Tax=Intrasporangium zincisolvens TaxID=3080018 RepID=UPI002B05200F|nr:DUF3352 domain-containing protein [Intrasporangium sp. YIM S08009]